MAYLSALNLFTIGIGPSSSHTVGPMRAAAMFASLLQESGQIKDVAGIRIWLYGSLGATGAGHGTDNAIVAGLAGSTPEGCNPIEVLGAFNAAIDAGRVHLLGKEIPFAKADLIYEPRTRLAHHSNGMRLLAIDVSGQTLADQTYFSVGGGFVEQADHASASQASVTQPLPDVPFDFESSSQLMELCSTTGQSIAQLAWQNELALRGETAVDAQLQATWAAMKACVESGLASDGVLPGYLAVNRRAAGMARRLRQMAESPTSLAHDLSAEWLQAYAIAVNEENAAGMRVVTAPTNGAAGIIPAVGYYARTFHGISDRSIERDYLLTAGSIGLLYKRNASISGAEAGCQGEVGSACSMAAAGLTAVLGGTPKQVENAAEIAMEHNLGLTCDPVGGFVQLPCIERNAIAAGTAVAATRLALMGDGSHKISLDTVIETMRQTGLDMSAKYKETSMGGLAVNVVEC
ncbi:MAG: L-serine ammonia-lyase [Micrococcales bacterium]